jgi:hypothetical protein
LPIFILLTSVIAFLITVPTAQAATSSTLNFQGRLATNTGALVADGSYNIEFKIYDDALAGTNLWTENRTGANTVTVRNGYFSVYLGEVTPFSASIPWDQELWMTMNVEGDGEMSPRFKLTAVPYAFRAGAITDAAGNAFTGDDLIQKAPTTIQTVNSALAAIRFNQAGSGGLLQLQGDGVNVFTVDKTGSVVLGSGITVGNSSSTIAGTIRWNGADLEVYDGSGWVSLTLGSSGGGGSSATITLIKSVDETITNNATLQNDDELFFPIGANESWVFRFTLQANSGTTPDFRFGVSAPGGATCSVGVIDPEGAISNAGLGCGVAITGIPGNGVNDVYEVVGSVDNGGTAGNVTLQWGQNTSNGAATIVRAGSTLFAVQEGSTSASSTFSLGGNTFGGTAILGTTDAYGLTFITDGAAAATISTSGNATFIYGVSVGDGLSVTSGISNNSGGITEAGAISGLTSLSSDGSLVISSSAGGDITLDSASDTLIVADSTIRRSGTGTTTIDLLDASSGTTLSILNSDGSQVAGLTVEGAVSAASLSGDGSGITALDGSAISSGTIADGRLTSNVALLNQSQTFTGMSTFDSGLILGNSTSTTAGAIRWNGTEFQGYNGIEWAGLGGGGGPPILADQSVFYAYDSAGNINITGGWTDLTLDTEVKEDAPYTHSTNSAEVAFNEDGWYEITYDVGTYISSGGSRTSSRAKIQEDTGSGYVDVPGSQATMYNRNSANGFDSASATILREFNAGDIIKIQAQSFNGTDTVLTEAETVRLVIKKFVTSGGGGGGGMEFVQGGNDFASTAIIGTTGNNDLNLITNNSTALSLTTSNQAIFSGAILANDGITIGDSSNDSFIIVSSEVTITNGLSFDSGTFAIDSLNDFVGINTSSPSNRLSINDADTADTSAQAMIATAGNTNKGLVIQAESGQSVNLFELQNNSGVVLSGFNSDGGLVLGLSTVTSTASSSQNITFGNESGVVCLSNSTNCGFLPLATGAFVTDATNNNSIALNKTSATGNLLALQRNGGAVFTVANTGALQIQSTDSNALDIRNLGGTSFFAVDTSSGQVRVGASTADAVGVLFVLDTKNTAGDPTGTDGGIYYNSSLGKFRCFEDGSWKDCIGTRQIRSFIDTTSDAVADNNTTNYWDTSAENNNSFPNITPSTTNKSITGSVSFETQSATTADRSVVARVERSIGTPAACNSGTPVGTILSTFTTNNGEQASNTMIFLDTPNTTSIVYYTLCADTATSSAASMTINRIRVTLEEANNSN